MGWRDELTTITLPDGRKLVAGSFRGVPFRTTGAELTGGRRNVLNEYPQRDMPYVDDLGRAARTYTVEAYLIGDDYLAQRHALQRALETAGPGELCHPRYGIVQVSLGGKYSFKESPERGGYCSVSVTFVQDGLNTFPAATRSTVEQVEAAANALDAAVQADFAERFAVTSGLLEADATAGLTASLAVLQATAQRAASSPSMTGVLGLLDGLQRDLAGLLQDPLALVQDLRAVYALVLEGLARPLVALADLQAVFASNARSGAVGLAGSNRALSIANDAARADLQRSLALSNQARALAVAIGQPSLVATSAQAVLLRRALVAQMDAELETNAPSLAVARCLSTLRAAVVRDVATRSELLLTRASYTPRSVLPALVLAHRIYQDATRADELVQRNGVRHPAFVPVKALEVLR
jgi:prophage DNA circulation protein